MSEAFSLVRFAVSMRSKSEPSNCSCSTTEGDEVPVAFGMGQEHRINFTQRLFSKTVAVAQREDSLLSQALFNAPQLPTVAITAAGIDPHAVGQERSTLARWAAHGPKNLRKYGSKVLLEWLPFTSSRSRREPYHLRLGEVDRRERCAPINRIATAGTGSGPHWEARLLKGANIPLDCADADFECLRQPLGRSANLAGATQLFTDCEKPIGSVHSKMVTYG